MKAGDNMCLKLLSPGLGSSFRGLLLYGPIQLFKNCLYARMNEGCVITTFCDIGGVNKFSQHSGILENLFSPSFNNI